MAAAGRVGQYRNRGEPGFPPSDCSQSTEIQLKMVGNSLVFRTAAWRDETKPRQLAVVHYAPNAHREMVLFSNTICSNIDQKDTSALHFAKWYCFQIQSVLVGLMVMVATMLAQ